MVFSENTPLPCWEEYLPRSSVSGSRLPCGHVTPAWTPSPRPGGLNPRVLACRQVHMLPESSETLQKAWGDTLPWGGILSSLGFLMVSGASQRGME